MSKKKRVKMKSASKIKISGRWLSLLSIVYLYLPLLVFFIAWTKWYFALLAVAASVYGCAALLKDDAHSPVQNDGVYISIMPLVIISLCLLITGLLSGWGGWMPQASDWTKHNALLKDLIHYDWPVYYKEAASPSMLTYYIGQYLIPALIGKLAGSFLAAEVAMYFWAEIGLFLVALHLIKILNAYTWFKQFSVIAIFILFNGCLILSQKLFQIGTGISGNDNQWMTSVNGSQLQYRGNYVDLRWVMPQCLAAWLTISLWWSRRQKVDLYIPLMLPALLCGALSFLGIVIMAFICAVYESIRNKQSFQEFLKTAFSLPNVITLIAIGMPLLLYFSGNVFSPKDPSVAFSVQHISFWLYFTFCLGHFGIYVLLSYKRHLQNGMFIGAVVLLLVLPFLRSAIITILSCQQAFPPSLCS